MRFRKTFYDRRCAGFVIPFYLEGMLLTWRTEAFNKELFGVPQIAIERGVWLQVVAPGRAGSCHFVLFGRPGERG